MSQQLQDLWRALDEADSEEEKARLRTAIEREIRHPTGGETVRWRPLSDWKDAQRPDAVIWREWDGHSSPLVSVGEPGILSAPGGSGKSYLSLQLAVAAAAAASGRSVETPVGLMVRAGPVGLVTYEDTPSVAAVRTKLIHGGTIPDGLFVAEDPAPLFHGDPETPGEPVPSAQWRALCAWANDMRPSLIIIDPVSEALADVSHNESRPVRTFLQHVCRLSADAGCGVLFVAHDTKSARNEAKASGRPGAGAVAGSSGWFDRARGVAYLHQDDEGRRTLQCEKVNHGPNWGSVTLTERRNGDGRFAGFTTADDLRTLATDYRMTADDF